MPKLKRGKVDLIILHEIIAREIHRALIETPPKLGGTYAETFAGAINIGVDNAADKLKDYLETEGIPVN